MVKVLLLSLLFFSYGNCEIINELYLYEDLEITNDYNETFSPIIVNSIVYDCAISVTWICDNCTYVIKYIVYWNETGSEEVSRNVFTYFIEGLLAHTPYEIFVSAVYFDGGEYESESIVQSTKTEVPPPPNNYFCETGSDDPESITMNWDEPYSTCFIIEYEVTTVGIILWNNSMTIRSGTTDKLKYKFTGLVPYTNYSTTVRSKVYDGEGYGLSSGACNMTTYEDVPDSPADLSVIEDSITSSSFSITWEDPIVQNGILIGFNVTLNDDEFAQYVMHSNGSYELTFENLMSSTNYTISVYAETGAGFGDPAETEAYTVDEI